MLKYHLVMGFFIFLKQKDFKTAETRNLQKFLTQLHPVQKRMKQVINYLWH